MAGPPFNIDNTNPTSSSLVSAFPPNEQANRTTIEEWLTFLSDPETGIIKPEALPDTVPPLPSGTRMLFQQTTAPTGWTKDTTHDNKALRVVSGTVGSGGSVDFTSAFASQSVTGTLNSVAATGTVGDTTLSEAQIPAHSHTQAGTFTSSGAGSHRHSLYSTTSSSGSTFGLGHGSNRGVGGPDVSGGEGYRANSGNGAVVMTDPGNHTHSITLSGETENTGGGGSHTHSFTGTSHTHTFTGTAINLAVAYVDLIIAERD